MSKSNTFENDLLKLIFLGTAIADLAENDTTSPATNLYVSLHTSDPGEAGSQTTNECNYTSYSRVAVARSGSGWTVTTNTAELAANADFPNPTDATNLPQTATHWAVGTAASGAGKVLYKGTITPNIVISNTGVTPRLAAGTAVTED